LRFQIQAGDIEHGGSASARIKSELTRSGVDPSTARRVGIVSFEAEMNLIVYSDRGGSLTVRVEPEAVVVEIEDSGPGIEDIELAMTPGYSTAPEWATDLGFGAGMGLANMKVNADGFEIWSQPGEGTRITCRIDRAGSAAPGRKEGHETE